MKKRHIAEKNILILIFSLLPFVISLLLSISTSNDRGYLSEAINIAGSQRMRTIAISNNIQHYKDDPESFEILETLNSEIDTYLKFYDFLKDSNKNIKYFKDQTDEMDNRLTEIKQYIDEYIFHSKNIVESGITDVSYDYVVGHAFELKDLYHDITEEYQMINDSYISRQNTLDSAMIIFAILATVVGFILSLRIKQLELQMYKETEHAIEAERVKSEFLSNMSHEIRTPLNGIMGMIELSLNDIHDQKVRENLIIANRSSKVLLTILNDILDYSKLEIGKVELHYEYFSLRTLMHNVSKLFRHQIESNNIEFKTTYEGDLPNEIRSDYVRLIQVLTNLVNNAIKFTQEGSVELKVVLKSKTDVFIILEFSVIDTGIGIDADKMNGLFERFNQLDTSTTKEFGGTGLGLSISSSLVELLGSEIKCESEKGVGSRFSFNLECAYGKRSYIEELPKDPVENISGAGKTILVAEDDIVNQKILQMYLGNFGFEVHIANNGEEAVQMFNENDYSLILMDVSMPVLDGFAALKQIRNSDHVKSETMPIVALTAFSLEDFKNKYITEGFSYYLAKPIEFEVLNQVLVDFIKDE